MAPIGRVGQIPCQPCSRRTQASQPPVLTGLNAEAGGCFAVVNQCADRLVALGVELPTWEALSSQAPHLITSMPHLSKNHVSTEVGSNTSPTPSRICSRPRHCDHLWTRMRERWRYPRVVLWQGSHSIACPQVTRLDWTPKISVRCSFADSAYFCPLTRSSADVAVSSTALAIIGLRALFRVLSVAEVSRWRWPWHVSAEKVEQGFQPM